MRRNGNIRQLFITQTILDETDLLILMKIESLIFSTTPE